MKKSYYGVFDLDVLSYKERQHSKPVIERDPDLVSEEEVYQIKKDIEEMAFANEPFFQGELWSCGDFDWETMIEDMCAFSKKRPDCFFILTQKNPYEMKFSRHYFHNGKYLSVEGFIRYPLFNLDKMTEPEKTN